VIRRFVDSGATFRFVDATAGGLARGEVRFDVVGGEFSHEGDRCTFEVLMERFGLRDPALGPIAEVVHDVDLKDGKYDRADTPGVQQLFNGIVAAHENDDDRLERGFVLLDDLYASFRKSMTTAPQSAPGGRTTKRRFRRVATRRSARSAAHRSGGAL
jgi:hypothetical protein